MRMCIKAWPIFDTARGKAANSFTFPPTHTVVHGAKVVARLHVPQRKHRLLLPGRALLKVLERQLHVLLHPYPVEVRIAQAVVASSIALSRKRNMKGNVR